MSEPFTQQERDALVLRVREAEQLMLSSGKDDNNSILHFTRKKDTYLQLLGEYADRLPRLAMSACPFTGKIVRRTIDPFGTDGPWWHKDRVFTPEEPDAPPSFHVLLGALDLRGRAPQESTDTVLAGPDAPFVVPALLEMPEMIAVVSRVEFATGDLAYPIAYFSTEKFPGSALHQFWTRPEHWFTDDEGNRSWTVATDLWDFDLAPYVASGKLRWIEPGDAEMRVRDGLTGGRCPYVGLPGDRLPQLLGGGERDLEDLPSGNPAQPFEE